MNVRKLSIKEALHIAEDIEHGRHNFVTDDDRYAPLWDHHFLSEAFLAMMQAYAAHENIEFHRHNFENICAIMCPSFQHILDCIDLPEVAMSLA